MGFSSATQRLHWVCSASCARLLLSRFQCSKKCAAILYVALYYIYTYTDIYIYIYIYMCVCMYLHQYALSNIYIVHKTKLVATNVSYLTKGVERLFHGKFQIFFCFFWYQKNNASLQLDMHSTFMLDFDPFCEA